GEGYSIFIRLSSPVSVNNTYQVGVQTDNGVILAKNIITPAVYVNLVAGEKWAAHAWVIVPSETFDNEINQIEQNRQRQKEQITSLKYEIGKITLNAIQSGAWITGPSPADQRKVEQLQSKIDELNSKINLDNETEVVP
ncbi:MAG: hypothetical protein Q7K41_00130, partial [Dehalococcoidales bacterium]|nr:hypothetical protein [Dehalococcoidales bacterium]